MKWLLLLLLLAACGREGDSDSTPRPDVAAVRATYLSLNQDAWIEGCDSLLFTALQSIGRGPGHTTLDLRQAEISPGHWYRNPSHKGCDDDVSRDMLLGVIAYGLEFKRLDILNDLWDYGYDNGWKMGADDGSLNSVGRTFMTPSLRGVLAKVIAHLGGPKHVERFLPNPLSAQQGFAGHLTLLNLWILDRVDGELGPANRTVLASFGSALQTNALLSYLYNKYNGLSQDNTVALLLKYPANRLPTGSDWCEAWLQQRVGTEANQGTCEERGPWSGGDFLFVSRMVLNGQ